MSKTKRYEEEVALTIRIPKSLHKKATAIIRLAVDEGFETELVGGCDYVKPSINVLAAKGIEREIRALAARIANFAPANTGRETLKAILE